MTSVRSSILSRGGASSRVSGELNEVCGVNAATVLIKRYGEDAPIEAALRADELLDRGDIDGERTWIRIAKAIDELLSKECPEGAGVH